VSDDDDDDASFTYVVSDEMLARFATSTIAQRLQWLEEMRTFSWQMASPQIRERWRRARAFGRWLGD
jgi:hypothetical protein